MKKLLFLVFMSVSVMFANGHGGHKQEMKNFRAVKVNDATILQKGEGKNFCPICGMTLPMFYKTNHAAEHKGETKQYCSVHCMIEDKELNKTKTSNEKVVDTNSLKFIDVKSATYVVGSKKPGTMSPVSKYAFSSKKEAQEFAKKNGGEIKSYDEVYALVSKGMAKAKAMINKKQAKAAKMGEKIYAKVCKKTDKNFDSPSSAKTYVVNEKLCGNLKGKKLQQVSLYLSKR